MKLEGIFAVSLGWPDEMQTVKEHANNLKRSSRFFVWLCTIVSYLHTNSEECLQISISLYQSLFTCQVSFTLV